MKKPILFAVTIILLLTTGCQKSETSNINNCVWSSAILKGRTFRISKITKIDNGTTTDETPTTTCVEFVFDESIERQKVLSGALCSGTDITFTYSASTDNGVNYLNQTRSGSSTTNKTKISSFDCISYTTFTDYGGGTTQYVTYTKQ